MADRTIGELVAAPQVFPADLFVLEQGGTAKKLTGQVLENWLLSFAKGHGGIQKIEKKSTAGLIDTYRITYSDTTVTDFTVTNGEKGDKGDNTYTWIKYASKNPAEAPHSFGDIPDKWVGFYVGPKNKAPTVWSEYKWYEIKGDKGDPGIAAKLISAKTEYQSSTSGTDIPSGKWLSVAPSVPQGQYLWVRITIEFNTGNPVVFYSVSRMGLDGIGTVRSVANIFPDSGGNVPMRAGDIGAIEDGNGTVTQENIQKGAVTKSYTITVPSSGWSVAGALQSKTISVPGIIATSAVFADVDLDKIATDEIEATLDRWSSILKIKVQNSSIVIIASDVPEAAIPIKLLEVLK